MAHLMPAAGGKTAFKDIFRFNKVQPYCPDRSEVAADPCQRCKDDYPEVDHQTTAEMCQPDPPQQQLHPQSQNTDTACGRQPGEGCHGLIDPRFVHSPPQRTPDKCPNCRQGKGADLTWSLPQGFTPQGNFKCCEDRLQETIDKANNRCNSCSSDNSSNNNNSNNNINNNNNPSDDEACLEECRPPGPSPPQRPAHPNVPVDWCYPVMDCGSWPSIRAPRPRCLSPEVYQGTGWGYCPPCVDYRALVRPRDKSLPDSTRPTGFPYFTHGKHRLPEPIIPKATRGDFHFCDWLATVPDREPPEEFEHQCVPTLCTWCGPEHVDCCPRYRDPRAYTLARRY